MFLPVRLALATSTRHQLERNRNNVMHFLVLIERAVLGTLLGQVTVECGRRMGRTGHRNSFRALLFVILVTVIPIFRII